MIIPMLSDKILSTLSERTHEFNLLSSLLQVYVDLKQSGVENENIYMLKIFLSRNYDLKMSIIKNLRKKKRVHMQLIKNTVSLKIDFKAVKTLESIPTAWVLSML